MKISIAASILLFVPMAAIAQQPVSPREVTEMVVDTANAYARAVSCQGEEVKPENVVVISPFTSTDDRDSADYAVIWHGDIGCSGGNFTVSTNIARIKIGIGNSYYVDLEKSSPKVDLGIGRDGSLVGATHNTLIFETTEYADGDANCCPSITKRIVLQEDENGNWK